MKCISPNILHFFLTRTRNYVFNMHQWSFLWFDTQILLKFKFSHDPLQKIIPKNYTLNRKFKIVRRFNSQAYLLNSNGSIPQESHWKKALIKFIFNFNLNGSSNPPIPPIFRFRSLRFYFAPGNNCVYLDLISLY